MILVLGHGHPPFFGTTNLLASHLTSLPSPSSIWVPPTSLPSLMAFLLWTPSWPIKSHLDSPRAFSARLQPTLHYKTRSSALWTQFLICRCSGIRRGCRRSHTSKGPHRSIHAQGQKPRGDDLTYGFCDRFWPVLHKPFHAMVQETLLPVNCPSA